MLGGNMAWMMRCHLAALRRRSECDSGTLREWNSLAQARDRQIIVELAVLLDFPLHVTAVLSRPFFWDRLLGADATLQL